jgi:hypothetical protein
MVCPLIGIVGTTRTKSLPSLEIPEASRDRKRPQRWQRRELLEVKTALAAEFKVSRGMEAATPSHVQQSIRPFVALHLDVAAQQPTMDAQRLAMMARSNGEYDGGQHPHGYHRAKDQHQGRWLNGFRFPFS